MFVNYLLCFVTHSFWTLSWQCVTPLMMSPERKGNTSSPNGTPPTWTSATGPGSLGESSTLRSSLTALWLSRETSRSLYLYSTPRTAGELSVLLLW